MVIKNRAILTQSIPIFLLAKINHQSHKIVELITFFKPCLTHLHKIRAFCLVDPLPKSIYLCFSNAVLFKLLDTLRRRVIPAFLQVPLELQDPHRLRSDVLRKSLEVFNNVLCALIRILLCESKCKACSGTVRGQPTAQRLLSLYLFHHRGQIQTDSKTDSKPYKVQCRIGIAKPCFQALLGVNMGLAVDQAEPHRIRFVYLCGLCKFQILCNRRRPTKMVPRKPSVLDGPSNRVKRSLGQTEWQLITHDLAIVLGHGSEEKRNPNLMP